MVAKVAGGPQPGLFSLSLLSLLLGCFLLVVVAVAATEEPSAPPPPPPYDTRYFPQTIDHFNYENKGTYQQRYLFADKYWGTPDGMFSNIGGCKGPILFYTGNESPVTDYYDASGLFTQVLAPRFGALLVFAEHRYFGESLPFGKDSFQPGKIGYCSPDQALADYAMLLNNLTNSLEGAKGCPVVAFGGSYGGMLTTWFRAKYPNVVIGGLAASAPFGFYGTGTSPYAFSDATTETFAQAKPGCDKTISAVFDQMQKLAVTASGRQKLAHDFKLCHGTKKDRILSKEGAEQLIAWVVDGLQGMCMLDYPYPTNYGISLPGWPVNATCDRLMSGTYNDPVQAMAWAIGVYYNNTGDKTCYNISSDGPDWGTGSGWPYLFCTSTYLPSANRYMFPYTEYNVTADIEMCRQQFGVELQPEWPKMHWGGFDLGAASNIIFSNGLLDPWHSTGILKSLSGSLIAIVIPEAAHHLDLRGPNKADPIYVKEARMQEELIITTWLIQHYSTQHTTTLQ
ncbi:Dipeptidyl peptidase 7 [Balamuthia mandrillaris]